MSSFKIKILLAGGLASGKEELIQRFLENRFAQNYILTTGVDILTKEVEFKPGEIAILRIWNIGLQQRFESIRGTFYKDAKGAIFVFDLTRRATLAEAVKWIQEVRQITEERIPILLIGNETKIKDDEIFINNREIQDFVKRENLSYVKTKMKTEGNIEEAFTQLTRLIIEQRKQ